VGAKRILVVSYPFPPMPTVGGNRWLAMSKYLRRAGYEVDILTTSAFGSLPSDLDESVHRAADLVGSTWLRRALRRPQLPEPGEPAAEDTPPPALVTKVVVPDHNAATWLPFAAATARRLVERRAFDCVVTTSAYESAHLVPLALGRRRPAWIADFRDGWRFHPWKPPYPTRAQQRLDAYLERRVVTTAERTTCVEAPVAEDFRARLHIDATVVPNGWDPDLAAEAAAASLPPLADDRFLLVHTGKLSGGWGRDPAPLLRALVQLSEGSPSIAERLQLVLAGRPDQPERELIDSFRLGDLVAHLGHLSRAQSMALQRRAGALVLITGPNLVWELPGKLFEYIGAGRPVLALASGNEAARVVAETGIGWNVDPEDVGAIADALRRAVEGELERDYAPHDLDRYTYPGPAELMAEIVESAIERRDRSAGTR
jgi:glycosyltransferase involved in cell wall biosynthesis